MIFLLRVICLSILGVCISGHAFTSCQANSPITISAINLTPDPPTAGKDLVIQVDGSSSQDLDKLNANIDVKAYGIKVLSTSLDICTVVTCPIAGNKPFSFTITEAIPNNVPAGIKVDVELTVTDTTQVACIDMSFTFGKASSILRATDSVAVLYNLWRIQHGKDENAHHLKNFRSNFIKVSEHNKKHEVGLSTFKMGLNKFAHLSAEEFKSMYLGSVIPAVSANLVFTGANMESNSETINWVAQGKVLKTRDQGQAGTCWEHSTSSCASAANAITNGKMLEFSVQLINDCVNSKYGYQSQGTQGGIPSEAMDFMVKFGVELESAYPYTQTDGTCQKSKHPVVAHFSQYVSVQGSDEDAMLKALSQQPLSVAINADVLQSYSEGIVMESDCSSDGLNHAVLVVGSGVDEQTGTSYWIVQNSWGDSFGETVSGMGGFFRLQRGASDPLGTCGVATEPLYIIATKTSSTIESA